MARNPYENLPQDAFWRPAVAEREVHDISGLWHPRHPLKPEHRVATAGSCFAQHIGRALKANGFSWFDAEPAPGCFSEETKKQFGYGVFSFRTGNIYTAAALNQWVSWALGDTTPPDETWETDGRWYDPFRPNIEPGGFASADEMHASRETTLRAIRHVIRKAHTFVFTLGLTEAWINREHGYTYAMCPGTIAGEFDPQQHAFHNFRFDEIFRDLSTCMDRIRRENSRMRFLLTVSPVPLTATASGEHVLTATTHSKSVLRAVAGQLVVDRDDTDYFPSYEIITAPPFRGDFYAGNLRSVTPEGVAFVMQMFFRCLEAEFGNIESPVTRKKKKRKKSNAEKTATEAAEAVCEEEMLEAFEDPDK